MSIKEIKYYVAIKLKERLSSLNATGGGWAWIFDNKGRRIISVSREVRTCVERCQSHSNKWTVDPRGSCGWQKSTNWFGWQLPNRNLFRGSIFTPAFPISPFRACPPCSVNPSKMELSPTIPNCVWFKTSPFPAVSTINNDPVLFGPASTEATKHCWLNPLRALGNRRHFSWIFLDRLASTGLRDWTADFGLHSKLLSVWARKTHSKSWLNCSSSRFGATFSSLSKRIDKLAGTSPFWGPAVRFLLPCSSTTWKSRRRAKSLLKTSSRTFSKKCSTTSIRDGLLCPWLDWRPSRSSWRRTSTTLLTWKRNVWDFCSLPSGWTASSIYWHLHICTRLRGLRKQLLLLWRGTAKKFAYETTG